MPEDFDYNVFPAVTIGGGSGDYLLRVPVSSKDTTEFCVVSVASLTANPGTVQVSGIDRPTTINGAPTFTDANFIRGQVIAVGANNTIPMGESFYDQINLPRGEVYVRIDGTNAYILVTIKFRVKILKKVPAPFRTVKPEQEQLVHQERERRIQEAVLAQEGEQYTYGKRPPGEPIIEPEPAGTAPATRLGYWGKLTRGS